MLERDPRRLAAWGGAVLILVLLAAWYLARSRPTASAAPPPGGVGTDRGDQHPRAARARNASWSTSRARSSALASIA